MGIRSVIVLTIFLAAVPTGAQFWCAGETGTLTPTTTFTAAAVCPPEPGDKLMLFPWPALQAGTWTTPFQLEAGDEVTILGYSGAGDPLFKIAEHDGPADGARLEIRESGLFVDSADGKETYFYGHLDTLPPTCSLGDQATRTVPLSLPVRVETCFCAVVDSWTCWSDGEFDFTGEIRHQLPGDSFTLRDSSNAEIFTVNSGGFVMGGAKMIDVDEIRGATVATNRILIGGSSITLAASSSYRLSAPSGGVLFNYNNSGMSFGPSSIQTSAEGRTSINYGTLTTAAVCNTGLAGSFYFDFDGNTSCRCDATGTWVNEGVGPGPCA